MKIQTDKFNYPENKAPCVLPKQLKTNKDAKVFVVIHITNKILISFIVYV